MNDFDREDNLYFDIVNASDDIENKEEVLQAIKDFGCTPIVPLASEDLEFAVANIVMSDNPSGKIAALVQTNHMQDVTIYNLNKLIDKASSDVDRLNGIKERLIEDFIIESESKNLYKEQVAALTSNLDELFMQYEELSKEYQSELVNSDNLLQSNEALASSHLVMEEELQRYESMGFWARLKFFLTSTVS